MQKPNAVMPFVPGHEEDGFLKKLDISKEDIEAKADGCTKVSKRKDPDEEGERETP